MKFSAIAQSVGITEHSSLTEFPDRDPEVTAVSAIQTAPTATISYIEGGKFSRYVTTTQASALILPNDGSLQAQANARGIAWLSTSDPRLGFARTIALFYQPFRLSPEIHATAVIHPTATLGTDVAIGAHVVVQAGVTIGDGVCIHPNAVIYPGATIGDRSVLHANCVIHERAHIGADCVIHSGAVIGSEGFGFVPTATGWEKMEQSGLTVLEDGVEIGCNSAVDRPAVGETRIQAGTKLDNLVHIAHGCTVGKSSVMAAQVGLAGGVTVGNRATLAGQVGVSNQATIGDGAIATAKTGVHSNVKPGDIVSGNPALPYKVYLKASAIMSRLPDMYQTLRNISRQRHSE